MPRSDDTKTNMAARLRALAAHMEQDPDPATSANAIKMIFDLKGAASHLDDLDRLLEMLTPPVRLGDICELENVAAEIRERKEKGSDPEPRMG
jgi:hypothetical protein